MQTRQMKNLFSDIFSFLDSSMTKRKIAFITELTNNFHEIFYIDFGKQ